MSEKGLLCADDKDEFVAPMWPNFPDARNEIDSVVPVQIPGKLSGEEACVKNVKITAQMCSHCFSIALAQAQAYIALLALRRRLMYCSGA